MHESIRFRQVLKRPVYFLRGPRPRSFPDFHKTGAELSLRMFVINVYPGKIVRPIPSPAGDTHCLALLKPWKPIGNQKAPFRVEIESLDFLSTKYFKCAMLFASPSLSCRSVWLFALFKMAFKKFHKKLSVCKT